MPFDPALPADNSPLCSAEMRGQLNALNDQIAALTSQLADLTDAVSQCQTSDQVYALIKANAASRVQSLPPPSVIIGNPPTQAQVGAVEDYIGQLYSELTSS